MFAARSLLRRTVGSLPRAAITAAATVTAGSALVTAAYCEPYQPPNRTTAEWKKTLQDGRLMMGCASNTSSTLCAELIAAQGFDFVLIDAQHSAVDPEKLRCMIQAVHAGGSKAFVRVGGHLDRIGIQQSLDLGADGILVPCVNTAEDVALAVSCAKYPVHGPGSDGGTRSVYLNLRPQFPGGVVPLFKYVNEQANKESIVMVQIETNDALENVEQICAVPGLDVAFIGPGDLATSMGLVRELGMPACWGHPRFAAAKERIAAACKSSGVVAGIWNGTDTNGLKAAAAQGFRFMVVDADILAMSSGLSAGLAEKVKAREELGCA